MSAISFPRSFSLLMPLLWVAAMFLLLLAVRSVLQNRSSHKGRDREAIEWGPPRPSLIQIWRTKIGRIRFRLPRFSQRQMPEIALLDEEVSIGGVNFFGGTMWTDFNGGDLRAMETARSQMNDYRLIYNPDETPFTPADSIALHKNFASKLLKWFGKNLSGPHVVISHNAPVINPNSKYKGGPLTPAFNSLDMVEIIGARQPALWVYGHTHECDDQTIGRTRIISNQLGYPGNLGGFECKDFDEAGLPVEVGV
jgi:hypothetical protein